MTDHVIPLFRPTTQIVSTGGTACPAPKPRRADPDALTWAQSLKATVTRRNRSWALRVLQRYADHDYRTLQTAHQIIRETPDNNLIRQRADQLMQQLGLAL